MKKYDTVIFFLLIVLAFSVTTNFAFASEGNDDDRYDDDSKTGYKEEREDYREERKEYRESIVCTNDGECVEDEEFREAREDYRQEREEYRSDKQTSPESKQQGKKYAQMLQVLGNAKFGEGFILPPRIQMLLVEDNTEIECKNGLELVFKVSNDIPLCVKNTTASKLLGNGIVYN